VVKKTALFLFCCFTLLSAQNTTPKLILFISIDQMRADYFERYGKYFTGGFNRLYTRGIVYTHADLNYATSETGPGHATLSTGCFPWKSGIHGNDWIDQKSLNDEYCVSDTTAREVEGYGGGVSPKNLQVTAIGDWLKEYSPASKVIAVSTKDRAAILMGGKHPDAVYWYSKKTGGMVTSSYYMTSFPQWVKDFNKSDWFAKNVPAEWTKSLPESVYSNIGPDEFEAEAKWGSNTSFPHPFVKTKVAEQIVGSPYGDKVVVDFAKEAVKHERLGQRNVTDLLCISLSNCDYVGHAQGPDSHEMLDLLIKIDGYLGDLFVYLDSVVGKDKYIVALSADHAVCPLPEFNAQFQNIPAKRYRYATDIKPKLDSLQQALKAELNTHDDIIIKSAFLNYAAAAKAGLDSLQLEQRVKNGLLSIEAFVDVYFRRELISREPSNKPFIEKYRHSYYAPRGEDFQRRIREYCIISSQPYGTTHGSPYPYDTHIPVIFWWSGAISKKISHTVFSADVAPTLAKFIGFKFPSGIDGKPLKEVVQ